MEPEYKEDVVYVSPIIRRYWTCHNPDHHHMTREVALKCIEKQEKPKKPIFRWTDEMYEDVLSLYEEGKTLAEISEKYGRSRSRMQQIVWRAYHRRHKFVKKTR